MIPRTIYEALEAATSLIENEVDRLSDSQVSALLRTLEKDQQRRLNRQSCEALGRILNVLPDLNEHDLANLKKRVNQ